MDYHELIKSIRELLNNLINRSDDIADTYRSLQYEEANERLSYFCEDTVTLVEGIVVLVEDYPSLNAEELEENIQLVYEGMKNKDYMMIADLLQHELKYLLIDWEKVFADEQVQ
ncbi:hypothetical protein [Salibacterium aidingense]|uniref:hypothetical protein n=1 Tax=Salibacterium aidingense TaxID=384933 RepID=UPI003BE6A2FD